MKRGFTFNIFGLLNTPKDNSIYSIKASIGNDYSTLLEQVDWEFTTQRQFRFKYLEDFTVQKD